MLRRLQLAIVAGAMLFAPSLPAQVDEYHVKAFFLYNFARYVEWPGPSGKEPIGICLLGFDPFGPTLDLAVSGKAVNGRPFVIRRISDLPPDAACNIVFVHSSEQKRFRAKISAIRGAGILSVGETSTFLADGGVINFFLEDGKVRFEINAAAASRERLRISSRLMSLSQSPKGDSQ